MSAGGLSGLGGIPRVEAAALALKREDGHYSLVSTFVLHSPRGIGAVLGALLPSAAVLPIRTNRIPGARR
jgi:hypothetical protein